MTIRLGLEARLNLSIALIMVLIIGSGFAWAVRDARHSIRQEASASVGLALGLIDAALMSGDLKPAAIQDWIERIGRLDRIRHLRISVTPRDRDAIHQWGITTQPMTQDVPGWFRWAVVSEPIVVVREVILASGLPVLIHVASYAEDEIREAWEETRGLLLLLLLTVLAIYLVVHLIAGRALRPVARILRGLNSMEEGDFETRLPGFGLPELDRLSQGINHLSATLREARDENRALVRHSLLIQEDERRSIAQEIHDEFGQNLTAIKMMSGVMQGNSEARANAAGEIQRLCDRLFGVVRSLMRRLRPMALEDLGLQAGLDELVAHWCMTVPDLQIAIHCDSALEGLKGEMALELYRIVQEALTNTVRHSGASAAKVQIDKRSDETIVLSLTDNGRGMTEETPKLGFGLLGMRERVASLQGQFRLINHPGQGFEIRITLPMKEGAT